MKAADIAGYALLGIGIAIGGCVVGLPFAGLVAWSLDEFQGRHRCQAPLEVRPADHDAIRMEPAR